MKKNILMYVAVATLWFSSCEKSAENTQSSDSAPKLTNKSSVASASALAAPLCSDCQESPQRVADAPAIQLAQQFAPLVKFDRAAPDYPTTVENIWSCTDQASIKCGGKLSMFDRSAPRTLDFPTYFDVTANPNDANRIYIEYWWAYKRQGNCIGSTGGHDYDWEHMVIQVDKSANKAISVTYFQHSGWYTKNWRNKATGTQIEGYVGKVQHGMYDFANSTSVVGYECAYWGDYRNPNGAKDQVYTSNKLVRMSCNSAQFSFNGDWGNVGKGPLYRDRSYWNFASCKGTDGALGKADGCSECDFSSSIVLGSL